MSTRRAFLVQSTVSALALAVSDAAAAGRGPAKKRADSSPPPTPPGTVQTVMGPIPGDRMGFTASHEHILAGSTAILRLWPESVGGRARFISQSVARLKAAKAAGIDTMVDCTTADLGRDVRMMQEVSRGSGMQLVAVTGHWLTPTPSFEARSADELADFFTLEIERGIEDTGVKPGAIKAASGDVMTPFQETVFRAAARASRRTGVPVTTHSHARKRGGEKQAEILEQEGLDPRRVCIGHSDESPDFDYLAGLAKRGYALGMDHLFYGLPAMGAGTAGIPTWQERASTIKKLIDAGFNDRIFLATDWMSAFTAAPTGTMQRLAAANPDGELFNLRHTIPYLRQIGVTDEQIRMVTVANPRAFFAGPVSRQAA